MAKRKPSPGPICPDLLPPRSQAEWRAVSHELRAASKHNASIRHPMTIKVDCGGRRFISSWAYQTSVSCYRCDENGAAMIYAINAVRNLLTGYRSGDYEKRQARVWLATARAQRFQPFAAL